MKYKKYICLLLLLILVILAKATTHKKEYFNDSCHKNQSEYLKMLNPYIGKKEYILICSGGPTLNELKNIKKYIDFTKCYVIAVKNTIIKLKELNIIPDFIITNGTGHSNNINSIIDYFINRNSKFLCTSAPYGWEKNGLVNKCQLMLHNYSGKSAMKMTMNDENEAFSLDKLPIKKLSKDYKKDNLFWKKYSNSCVLSHHWGHIMCEIAIPLAIYLKPKKNKIFTIGWDIRLLNNKNIHDHHYWDTIEPFSQQNRENTVINFTSKLYNYILKHYAMKIYKLSKNSAIKIPHYEFNKK